MDWLVLIVAVPLLVWACVLAMRASIIAGCLAFVAVNAGFGYYFFHFRAGPVELTLDRVVLMGLGLLFVVQWRTGKLERKSFSKMDLAVLSLMAWLAIRTLTIDFWVGAAGESPPLWRFIVGYLSPLFIYWVARCSRQDEKSVRAVQKFFLLFGVYLAVTAVAEVTGQWWAVFPKHIADPDVGIHFGRARGPMVQSVVLGFCLTISAVCACVFKPKLGPWARRLLVAAVVLFLVGIFLSYTRCVWIGAAIALAAVVWLQTNWRVRTILVGTACVASLLVAATQWDRLQSFDAGRSAEASRDSANMRISFAYVSWKMFQDRPIAGCGLGRYMSEKDAYLSDRSTTLTLEHIRTQIHHNLFLSILVETGLIGFMLFILMLLLWARGAWRLWHCESAPAWARDHGLIMLGTLVAYLPNAFFQPLGHTNIAHMMFFLLAGVTAGLQPAVRREQLHDRNRRQQSAFNCQPSF